MRDVIKTERLVLRPLELSDAPAFSRLASDYDISKMTGSLPYPMPLYSAEFKIMYLRNHKERGLAFPYAITLEGEFIGVIDLFRSCLEETLEIGYWIGKPYWGKGLSTEAAKAIIAEARKSLGIDTLIAGAFEDNPASLRVLQKLGFKPTGKTEMYFSMGRMKKAKSIDLKLDLSAERQATPLRATQSVLMSV